MLRAVNKTKGFWFYDKATRNAKEKEAPFVFRVVKYN